MDGPHVGEALDKVVTVATPCRGGKKKKKMMAQHK